MPPKKASILPGMILVVVVELVSAAVPAFGASRERVLYNFKANGRDGRGPEAGLVADSAGNLYGVTRDGGAGGCQDPYGDIGCGAVFELVQQRSGQWAEEVLHSFKGADGAWPIADLVFDGAGNLYGTTIAGGSSGSGCYGYGCGTVFELMPREGGRWIEKVLHNFQENGKDGTRPAAGVTFDGAGNLYGTTSAGGVSGSGCGGSGCGTVFELARRTNGGWTEKILLDFVNDGAAGYNPHSRLIFDAAGNLYGTTECSYVYGGGTAFQLVPSGYGTWTENVLNEFGGSSGAYPVDGLIFDAAGNLYGTTWQGGSPDYGTAFELTISGGTWSEVVLHSFDYNGTDGYYPMSSLTFDAAGSLYGSTSSGGKNKYGTVFKLSPGANGSWTEKVLHNFGYGHGGVGPNGPLILDAAGNLYGTSDAGGTGSCKDSYGDTIGCGVVFEITP